MIKDLNRLHGIVMFYSDRNLKLLDGHLPKQVFADGTFTYTSYLWTQMLTFHIYKGGWYIPICHFLLPNKEADIYMIMLDMMRNACRLLSFEMDVDVFIHY